MSKLNSIKLWAAEQTRLADLIKNKPEGEFTKFPIFFPLTDIFLPKEHEPTKSVIEVGSVANALKNIEKEGNRPFCFASNEHWQMLLPNVATYLCGIVNDELLKGKDLSRCYLMVDTPQNSELIKSMCEAQQRIGRRPRYWAILVVPKQEEPAPQVEELAVKPEEPEVPAEEPVVSEQPADEATEVVEEEPAPTPEVVVEEPQKDA